MPKKLKTITNFEAKIAEVVGLSVTRNTVKKQEFFLLHLNPNRYKNGLFLYGLRIIIFF